MIRTGYVGVKSSYTQIAVKALRPVYEEQGYNTLEELVKALASENIEEIMVPVRDNLTGVFEETLNLINGIDYFVKGEHKIKVDATLCVKNKNKSIKDIKKIVTDKYLYEKCKDKLKLYFGSIPVEIVEDNSIAGRSLSKGIYSTDVGILCSEQVAIRYKLFMYRKYMTDDKHTFLICQALRLAS